MGYALRSPANGSYLGPVIFDAANITTTWPSTGEQMLSHLYTFSLAPGATKRLAYFVYRGLAEGVAGPDDCTYYGGCVTPATGTQITLAGNTVAGLVTNPALCDLSLAERATLVNWTVPLANCHDAFLPVIRR